MSARRSPSTNLRRRAWLPCLLSWLVLSAPAVASPLSFQLRDARGQLHSEQELREHRLTVLVFLGRECPLSNGYVPELNRIASEYGPRGVALLGVNADPDDAPEAIRKHDEEFLLSFPTLIDHGHVLVGYTGVAITPEVAVLDGGGRVLYRGRIDDRGIDFGKIRVEPRRRDLRIALDEILEGKPVSLPTTQPLGCAIPGAHR